MERRQATNVCPGCGGRFADAKNGTVHRHMESSPGCWAACGALLAREYERPTRRRAHEFAADTYAVQHPGQPSPQSVRSVALHLIWLCLMLERGASAEQATATMRAATRRKEVFRWLTSPPSQGAVTLADVHPAASPEEHAARVHARAGAAWAAWAAHHDTVRGWVDVLQAPDLLHKPA